MGGGVTTTAEIGSRLSTAWGLRGTAQGEPEVIAFGALADRLARLSTDYSLTVDVWRDAPRFTCYAAVGCPLCGDSNRVGLTDEQRHRGRWGPQLLDDVFAMSDRSRNHVEGHHSSVARPSR